MSSFALADGPQNVRVGISPNPPIGFIDSHGKPSGLAVDVINEIATRENWNVIFVKDLWVNLLKRIEAGEVDLIAGVAYSKERARQFDFNSVSLTNNWGVVYRHPKASINSIFELDGKRLALPEKSIHTRSILNLLNDYSISVTPVFTEGFHDAMVHVDTNKADAAIINRLFGYAQLHEHTAIETAIIFNPVQLRFITLKGQRSDLLTAIDSYLSDSKSDLDSSYYEHLNRWIEISDQTNIPQWVSWAFGVAAVITLFAASFILLLRQQVLARTASLRKSEENLRNTLDSEKKYSALQRQFVSLVSHEFRTPLSIIDSSAQRLIRRKDNTTPKQLAERCGKIRNTVGRMVSLIETTLYAENLDKGNFPFAPQLRDLKAIIAIACEHQADISPDHEIRMDIDGLPPVILADWKLLNHTFQNLLSNAVKYSPKSSLIEVKGWTEGDFALASIKDYGVGIPANEFGNLFQRFFRATTAKGIHGTGLGLSVCRQFVEMHGGDINVDSVEGEGTTFTVKLPIAEITPPETSA